MKILKHEIWGRVIPAHPSTSRFMFKWPWNSLDRQIWTLITDDILTTEIDENHQDNWSAADA